MRGKTFRGVVLLCLVWAPLSGVASATDADHGLVGTWTVNAGSAEEVLQLEAGESGLIGKLGQFELTGFVAGGEIVLRGDGIVLHGWFGRDVTGAPFMAGRQRLISGNVDRVSGWYAVPIDGSLEKEAADPPEFDTNDVDEARVQFFDFTIPEADTQTQGTTPGTPSASSSSAAASRRGDGSFSGTWKAAEGLYRIEQEGSRLTVLKPSGESVGGRQTGAGSLMVGLRVGCCRGELSSPGVIQWQDGAVWRRVD